MANLGYVHEFEVSGLLAILHKCVSSILRVGIQMRYTLSWATLFGGTFELSQMTLRVSFYTPGQGFPAI